MISVKIELTIGETVHHLTMDELRELRKVIDGLVAAPAPDDTNWLEKYNDWTKRLDEMGRNPPPYNPYPGTGNPPWITYLTKTGDVIPDPYVVTC